MDVIEAIDRRHAVREFTGAPIGKDQINSLITAAVQAPDAMGRQRWAFVVVPDRALLDRISGAAEDLTLRVMGSTPYLARCRNLLSSAQFNIFYDANVLIIICGTENNRFVDQDCCLAAQNLMLAARANGLGTCWIGFAEAWLNIATTPRRNWHSRAVPADCAHHLGLSAGRNAGTGTPPA
jgi:nitroreductase